MRRVRTAHAAPLLPFFVGTLSSSPGGGGCKTKASKSYRSDEALIGSVRTATAVTSSGASSSEELMVARACARRSSEQAASLHKKGVIF